MNARQVKACRKANIEKLAQLGGGDVQRANAKSLYNRCVRYCMRYFRWGEAQANGAGRCTRWQWEQHEGELLARLGKRLEAELKPYGLMWEYPGLYPVLVDERGNNPVELVWY